MRHCQLGADPCQLGAGAIQHLGVLADTMLDLAHQVRAGLELADVADDERELFPVLEQGAAQHVGPAQGVANIQQIGRQQTCAAQGIVDQRDQVMRPTQRQVRPSAQQLARFARFALPAAHLPQLGGRGEAQSQRPSGRKGGVFGQPSQDGGQL